MSDTTLQAEPIYCGLCLYGSDIGVPGYDDKGPAYVNPSCPDHNPATLTIADVSLAAADCPYGVGPGDGSGCIKASGHSGDHIVTPGVQVKRLDSLAETDTPST
ncbi:hypothetical protein AB0K62_13450 [Streptomyces halstedii]|uniref:hypothetical protein n=1 Tax=Streptomyces halstedii TaxID=1944 RepID=UPI00346042DE